MLSLTSRIHFIQLNVNLVCVLACKKILTFIQLTFLVARAINTIFSRWWITADNRWNISGNYAVEWLLIPACPTILASNATALTTTAVFATLLPCK